jgi:hypothetical protein
MTTGSKLERIKELLSQVPRAPDEPIPSGLTDEVVLEFEKRAGLSMPPEQAGLLRLSNGPCVGPGGIYGVRSTRHSLDIEEFYESYPGWKHRGWVPVAGDGCGNYYVALHADDEWPVVFIDTMQDAEQPAFVVASGVLAFVVFLLERELGETGWPFDEVKVTSSDPRIASFGDVFRLPWSR